MSGGESGEKLIESPSSVEFDGASNVLMLTEPLNDKARRSYYRKILPGEPSALDLLAVDYRRTPDQYLDEWRRYAGERPRRCGIICVDESTRSNDGWSGMDRGAVACVESPTDLTGLSIKASTYLEDHGDADTLVSFDSLTMLLQYVELQRAFRFLHVLAKRVQTVDAVAHYHMDPKAHDDREMATLSSLFDAIARFEGDGWRIRRR